MMVTLFIYFDNLNKKKNLKINQPLKKSSDEKVANIENNLITNLNYISKDFNNNSYNISADYGVIIDNSEKIEMTKPLAKITLNDGDIITISSEIALYNQENFNSNFLGNVKVKFNNKIITANKMDLDFVSNNIKIYENVLYKDAFRTMLSENLNLNLITKDIYINSDNENKRKVNFKTIY